MKKIKIKLEESSIDAAIKALAEYKKKLKVKKQRLIEELAYVGLSKATVTFSSADYDGLNDVEVTVEKISENKVAIVARGNAVAFIEFGTGVFNPEHPFADDLGMKHGTYGQGKGKSESWGYYGVAGTNGRYIKTTDRGDLYVTKGNPPALAMYYAEQEVLNKIREVAVKVFND